jgi:hypothetical protein
MVNHLYSNKDRHICIKTHTKANPEIQHNKHPKFTPKGLMITNRSFCHNDVVQSFQNSGIKLTEMSTPWEASHDAYSRHPPPTLAPSRAGSLRATHHQRHYLDQQIIARLSILILSKTYRSVITTSPTLDMKGILATGFLLLKSNKEYVLTFKISAQVLVGLLY